MLQRVRESLALVLILFLPLHAFLVTVLTKIIAGPDKPPLPLLAAWKEALLGIILIIACVEILMKLRVTGDELREKMHSPLATRHSPLDGIDCLILTLFFLSVVTSQYQLTTSSYLLGFRYDFAPLVAFVLLRRVAWSDAFMQRAMYLLLALGAALSLYGILTLFLPDGYFRALGYSLLHSLYIPGGPIAAFQYLGGTDLPRIQSTLSGPNQFGLWLLLPWSIALTMWKRAPKNLWHIVFPLLLAFAIFHTFSRSAWIAAAVIFLLILWSSRDLIVRRAMLVVTALGFLLAIALLSVAPDIVTRAASTDGHLRGAREAISTMREHPLGLGLGTAGPASNRTSDACVYLQKGDDALWARAHPQLCIFIDDAQIQPTNHACHCPVLPENWYLQIGVEMGWIGMLVWIFLVLFVTRYALRVLRATSNEQRATSEWIVASFIGVSIAALFLHAWEDAALAYTLWLALAVVLPVRRMR